MKLVEKTIHNIQVREYEKPKKIVVEVQTSDKGRATYVYTGHLAEEFIEKYKGLLRLRR